MGYVEDKGDWKREGRGERKDEIIKIKEEKRKKERVIKS